MSDIIAIALVLSFFGLCGVYIWGLDRLWRQP